MLTSPLPNHFNFGSIDLYAMSLISVYNTNINILKTGHHSGIINFKSILLPEDSNRGDDLAARVDVPRHS